MGNCMATRHDEADKNTSKVQPFKRDGSLLNKGPQLGSPRGFNELENSVTLHKQHTAKMKCSKIYESSPLHNNSNDENKSDELRSKEASGPQS